MLKTRLSIVVDPLEAFRGVKLLPLNFEQTQLVDFEYIVTSIHVSGVKPLNWGVLLVDAVSGRLHYRFRTDFDSQMIAAHFKTVAMQEGADALLAT